MGIALNQAHLEQEIRQRQELRATLML